VTSWWVVVNPSAGRGGDLSARTAAALAAAGADYELSVSPSPEAVAGVVADGVATGYTDFAAVGGDGMANMVLNGLMAHEWESPPTLAILPAGSGSDFIRTFALPRTLEGAVAHLLDDERYPTDVGIIEGRFGIRHFLNIAQVGIGARSAGIAASLPDRLGVARYTIAFWVALARFPSAKVSVEVDGRVLEGDVINVVIANGQFFGGGMNVAPRATVTDGVFDVQLFSGPRWQAPVVMPRVMFGTHLKHKAVRRTKGSSIVIECPKHWPVEADGETLGTGPIKVEVLPQAIQFKI
jgi:YegS/Rv2252/BmrU family lipid kinase